MEEPLIGQNLQCDIILFFERELKIRYYFNIHPWTWSNKSKQRYVEQNFLKNAGYKIIFVVYADRPANVVLVVGEMRIIIVFIFKCRGEAFAGLRRRPWCGARRRRPLFRRWGGDRKWGRCTSSAAPPHSLPPPSDGSRSSASPVLQTEQTNINKILTIGKQTKIKNPLNFPCVRKFEDKFIFGFYFRNLK